jgi:hypothetical protein
MVGNSIHAAASTSRQKHKAHSQPHDKATAHLNSSASVGVPVACYDNTVFGWMKSGMADAMISTISHNNLQLSRQYGPEPATLHWPSTAASTQPVLLCNGTAYKPTDFHSGAWITAVMQIGFLLVAAAGGKRLHSGWVHYTHCQIVRICCACLLILS